MKIVFDEHLFEAVMNKIDKLRLTLDKVRDMPAQELGHMINDKRSADFVKKMADKIPKISISASVQPITRTIVRLVCQIDVKMYWSDKERGNISISRRFLG